MNILNFLIKEERGVGVELSDTSIRIAYLLPLKKSERKSDSKRDPRATESSSDNRLILIEKTIPPGVISGGVITNKESLRKSLADVWLEAKLNQSGAIVAIPPHEIYSHIFNFPRAVTGQRLEEAVNLALDFQLPFKRQEVYTGWEKISSSTTDSEVLVSAAPKTIINDYIEVLGGAGVKVLALESHLASNARAIKTEPGSTTLITKQDQSDTSLFILKDNVVRFSRRIPASFIKDENHLRNEINNLKASFESKEKAPIRERSFAEAAIRDEYLKYPELRELDQPSQSKWVTSLGAHMRGEIPRSKDNQISLLPVSTADAYSFQKAVTFIGLLRNMTIAVSIFFLVTFSAAYLLTLSLFQNANSASVYTATTSTPTDIPKKEALIRNVNEMTLASEGILSTTPHWSILLDEINSRIISGITVSQFSVTSLHDPISLSGIAKDRHTLNQFKKSIQGSAYLAAIDLPITNVEQKGDIPFSISFRVKDPAMLYYK